MTKKKTIILTIIIVLLVEIILGLILLGILYYNYEKFSANESGISDKKIVGEIKDIEIEIPKSINSNTGGIYYSGSLGKIEIDTVENSLDEIYKYEKNIIIEINYEKIKQKMVFNILEKENLLDKYIYNHLNQSENFEKDIEELITFNLLLGRINEETGEKIIAQINKISSEIQTKFVPLIKTNNYEKISEYLKDIEKEYDLNSTPNNLYEQNSLIQNESFQLIIDAMFSEKYYGFVQEASKKTQIDEKLIMSSIGVEQLRFLVTDRGQLKNFLKQSQLLVNFNKFSHGLGGIKTETFKKINQELKENSEDLYKEYFEIYDLMARQENSENYSDANIQSILEDDYAGILYAAGLLYNIKEKWKNAGYPIDDKVGIIITLYNMGNKKEAHANPDMGGAMIVIDDENRYYFGELGLIMYEYMKYYK